MDINTHSINYWLSQTYDQHQQTIPAICRGSLTCSPSNKESRASSTDVACLFRTINLITKVSGVNTKQTMVLHPQGPLWSLHTLPYPTLVKPKALGYLKLIKRHPNAENPAQVSTCEMQVATCKLLFLRKPRNSSRSGPVKHRSRPALEFCLKLVFSPSKPRFFTTQMISKVSTHQITHFGRPTCTKHNLDLKESSILQTLKKNLKEHYG